MLPTTSSRGILAGMSEPDALLVRADVHIVDVSPTIARTLELPMDLNLAQLHEVL